METTTLSFDNIHQHGVLFSNLLRARHESFIVEQKWDLPQADGMEYDQYDNPSSRWIAVHDDNNKILAGIRITATTARCGIYSYMIRDAQRGLLDSIPDTLLYEDAPVDENIWESSRIFVARNVPASLRIKVQNRLMAELFKAGREVGASHVLGLVPAAWPRWLGRLGIEAKAAGPIMDIDGRDTQAMLIPLNGNLH